MNVLKNKKGFTLIEMLFVLTIISILIMLIIPNLSGKSEEVHETGCDALVAVVQAQVNTYQLENGAYPKSLAELEEKQYITKDQRQCSKETPIRYSEEDGQVYTSK